MAPHDRLVFGISVFLVIRCLCNSLKAVQSLMMFEACWGSWGASNVFFEHHSKRFIRRMRCLELKRGSLWKPETLGQLRFCFPRSHPIRLLRNQFPADELPNIRSWPLVAVWTSKTPSQKSSHLGVGIAVRMPGFMDYLGDWRSGYELYMMKSKTPRMADASCQSIQSMCFFSFLRTGRRGAFSTRREPARSKVSECLGEIHRAMKESCAICNATWVQKTCRLEEWILK